MTKTIVEYIGDGWIPGVPARDLTSADVKNLAGVTVAELVESGLYREPKTANVKKKSAPKRASGEKPGAKR